MTRRAALRIVAAAAIAGITALMWSDAAIGWSNSIFADLSRSGDGAAAVLEHRPAGDLDLHVVTWGIGASLTAVAMASPRRRLQALAAVLAWSAVVESLQPVFTETRMFQVTDLLGNGIGVALAAAGSAVAQLRVRTRH